ncbi:hypothetical protein K1719_026572 [Acacia pycnantha]|nr:hypothetical protein K1719_026572 [Acacia pycnantha]
MKPFSRTLVVKLLRRQPSYGFMVKKLRQLWERKGKIDIFNLENDFYLVNFQRMKDYMEALIGGPWVISDARNIEDGMAVDGKDAPKTNVVEKESEKGLWKTVQRFRRPRRQEPVVQIHQSGSRFTVLQEVSGGEQLAENVVNVQGPVSSNGVNKKWQGKGGPHKQSNQGRSSGGVGGFKKDSEMSRVKNKGRIDTPNKKEKEGAERIPFSETKLMNDNKGLKVNHYCPEEVVVVPETNLDPHEWQGVHMDDKENLNPGEHMDADWKKGVGDLEGMHIEGKFMEHS